MHGNGKVALPTADGKKGRQDTFVTTRGSWATNYTPSGIAVLAHPQAQLYQLFRSSLQHMRYEDAVVMPHELGLRLQPCSHSPSGILGSPQERRDTTKMSINPVELLHVGDVLKTSRPANKVN